MKTRCKFYCSDISKSVTTIHKNGESKETELFNVRFNAVVSGSTENEKFFAYTPSGQLTFSSVFEGDFEIGKQYYIDVTEVE